MRRSVIALALALASLLGMSFAQAGHEEKDGPGPNGHNNHGLCTAYFNGSETGRNNKHRAGPFVALEEAANARDGEDNDDDDQVDEADEVARAVWDWCVANTGGKGVGGNPTSPYPDPSPSSPSTPETEESNASSGGKGKGKK